MNILLSRAESSMKHLRKDYRQAETPSDMQDQFGHKDIDQQRDRIRHGRNQGVCHHRRVHADLFRTDGQHAAYHLGKDDDEQNREAVITAITKEKPYYFVMCDRSIATDNVADNFDQIFNAYSKETVRRIL